MIAKSRHILMVLATTIAMLLSLTWVSAAHAAPNIGNVDGEADTTLVIHKLEKPEEMGEAASGLPQNTSGMVPVAGATFSATLVPGIDLTKNQGWDDAQAMTPAEAATLIGSASPEATGTSDGEGRVALPLGVGLYYVQETHVPAGVVATDPFLVAMPIPHPTTDEWLYEVHIYPKNPRVTITLDVNDQTAVKIGDTVKWESKSTIPNNDEIDAYVVQNLINPKLKLSDKADEVVVTLVGGDSLVPGVDYVTEIKMLEGRETIEVVFSESGLAKLAEARAKNTDAHVSIKYNTEVLEVGIHENEARVQPDQRAVDGLTEPVRDEAITKWGPLSILVHEKGNPSNLIEGAKFKLYLTPEDALADRNPIIIEGVSEWFTDENGFLTIEGLRFSDYVNGLDRDTSDPLYRYYYAMPISYPPGWTGDMHPLQGSVHSVLEAEVLLALVWKKEEPEIPVTGGQIGMALLFGSILLGSGTVLLARKRRKGESVDEADRA